ncbi:uncharacterized protein BKA55DRAFT_557404 [Fusarium redolens]|uniref:Uncharacterized protein n=1 Tax=Fusarium redolens TaxID=48865 RepID=A0A9P9HWX0_FUSRE|nr:uncharacterized protein BKA55DRAFT_557404 [Fusarium redolens]KAH7264947.1 hypothetical protein BKA55DRAFT_557404 [Fusarium redolens]
MCYRIFTHAMRCDARPVISDGNNVYTDPFAYPLPCSCSSEHFVLRYLRCEDHGCCMKKLEMDWCPNVADCNEVYEVHRYVQSHRKPRNIWGPINMLGDNFSSLWSIPQIQEKVKPWDSVPDLEKCLFIGKMPHLTAVLPPFQQAVQNLVNTGRLIVQTQDQLGALRNDIAIRRTMHDTFHGEACSRVLNEWECPVQGPIATGEMLDGQMVKSLVKQQEIFNTCWTFIQSIMWSRQVGKSLMLKNVPVVWDQ